MTISVKITNESELHSMSGRSIEVIDGAGARYVVLPEDSVTVNVWEGTQITITEQPLPMRRGGSEGYGALPPR